MEELEKFALKTGTQFGDSRREFCGNSVKAMALSAFAPFLRHLFLEIQNGHESPLQEQKADNYYTAYRGEIFGVVPFEFVLPIQMKMKAPLLQAMFVLWKRFIEDAIRQAIKFRTESGGEAEALEPREVKMFMPKDAYWPRVSLSLFFHEHAEIGALIKKWEGIMHDALAFWSLENGDSPVIDMEVIVPRSVRDLNRRSDPSFDGRTAPVRVCMVEGEGPRSAWFIRCVFKDGLFAQSDLDLTLLPLPDKRPPQSRKVPVLKDPHTNVWRVAVKGVYAPIMVPLGWIDTYNTIGEPRKALGLMEPSLAEIARSQISRLTEDNILKELAQLSASGSDIAEAVSARRTHYALIEDALSRAFAKIFIFDYCERNGIESDEESFVFISTYEKRLYGFIREYVTAREAIRYILELYRKQPGDISELETEILFNSRYEKKPFIKG